MIAGTIRNEFGYCCYSFEEDYVHIYIDFIYIKIIEGMVKLGEF